MPDENTEQVATVEVEETSQPVETVSETPEKVVAEAEPVETPDEFETRVKSEVQSQVDIAVNKYRETRESDSAKLKELAEKNRELTQKSRTRNNEATLKSILDNADPTEEEQQRIKSHITDFYEREDKYINSSIEVEEAAQFIAELSKKMPEDIVKEFGLDDPNPGVRAAKGMDFVNGAIAQHKSNLDFTRVVDRVLTKGPEVRKQIEGFVKELAEYPDNKSKDLYLDKYTAGLKVTPKESPAAPSDSVVSGDDTKDLTSQERINRGLKKMKQEE